MMTVTLQMNDLLNETTIERTIDATNALSGSGESYVMGNSESQRKNLERWVEERGNEQHDTILELLSWEFNK